jgi:hypothetical protein
MDGGGMTLAQHLPAFERINKAEWEVTPVPLSVGQELVCKYHYSKGGSNTFVYMHVLVHKATGTLFGVAWWLPPTRVAAESVNKPHWKRVLALTRFVLLPEAPKNAASFLLSRSVKLIAKEGRFVSLVTYADESQGHLGIMYQAAGWAYVGRTGPYQRWVNVDGRQVSAKATVNRTVSEMLALGHQRAGSFFKHKYVKHLAQPAIPFNPLHIWMVAA